MTEEDQRAKKVAKQSDWKTEPMPASRATLSLDREYSAEEFARLSCGHIPEVMEDKWFVYFQDPDLYLHRSWTGYCCYIIEFAETAGGRSIVQVIANRDSEQYTEDNDTRDALLLAWLLDGWVGRPNEDTWSQYSAIL